MYELGLKGSVSAQDRIPGVISHAERSDRPNPSNGRYDYEQGEYILDAPLTPKQVGFLRRPKLYLEIFDLNVVSKV